MKKIDKIYTEWTESMTKMNYWCASYLKKKKEEKIKIIKKKLERVLGRSTE